MLKKGLLTADVYMLYLYGKVFLIKELGCK